MKDGLLVLKVSRARARCAGRVVIMLWCPPFSQGKLFSAEHYFVLTTREFCFYAGVEDDGKTPIGEATESLSKAEISQVRGSVERHAAAASLTVRRVPAGRLRERSRLHRNCWRNDLGADRGGQR